MTEYPWRDGETLRKLYWDDGMSMSDVADHLSCSRSTVKRWMKEHDIPRRDGKDKWPPRYHTHVSGYERWRHQSLGDDCTVRVHRLLAVAEYGFDAVSDMDVHHENSIPWDNRHDNISLISHKQHGKLHAEEQMK